MRLQDSVDADTGYHLDRPEAVVSPALIEVVSEEPASLRHTIARIRSDGHEVSLVTRMQEAGARRDLIEPDLVVLDARRDIVSGALLCRQLGGAEAGSELLVVLSPEQKDFRSRLVLLGAGDCVASGDDPEESVSGFKCCCAGVHVRGKSAAGSQTRSPCWLERSVTT